MMYLKDIASATLTINTASCKWRDTQRAISNRQFTGYTLGPLERNVRGRLFDSEGEGGGAVIFC